MLDSFEIDYFLHQTNCIMNFVNIYIKGEQSAI